MTDAKAFDFEGCVKRLVAGGFTEKQARAVAEGHAEIFRINRAIEADRARAMAGPATESRHPED